jgi:hypothetical protein
MDDRYTDIDRKVWGVREYAALIKDSRWKDILDKNLSLPIGQIKFKLHKLSSCSIF